MFLAVENDAFALSVFCENLGAAYVQDRRLWIWIWTWMGNFISTSSLQIARLHLPDGIIRLTFWLQFATACFRWKLTQNLFSRPGL